MSAQSDSLVVEEAQEQSCGFAAGQVWKQNAEVNIAGDISYMRDRLCREEFLEIVIECNNEFIDEALKEIELLKADSQKGIQTYPTISNQDAISRKKESVFQWINEEISAGYSLGQACEVIEELFHKALMYIKEIRYNETGYIPVLKFMALGILLEVSEAEFKILTEVADAAGIDDILLDCLINAYGLKRNIKSSGYEKELPYKEAVDIMELAASDKIKAAAELKQYVQNKWLKGHADYGWTKAHKEEGYLGLWSFEAAAIAKIFTLDDAVLKEDNHYPYELAHYKNSMVFNTEIDLPQEKTQEDKQDEKFIPAEPELEQIVPKQFRKEINQLLVDFSTLKDEEFHSRYRLDELWYTPEEYREDKANKPVLGIIVINYLVSCGYILQLDYKEDVEDYADTINNYWKDDEVKLIRFELNNDQNYYVKVPCTCKLKTIYNIKIDEN